MPKKKINVADLKQIARYQAVRYLVQENVTSVGVGYKVKDGKQTNELCIQFTVGQKIALESLDGAGLAFRGSSDDPLLQDTGGATFQPYPLLKALRKHHQFEN